MRQKLPLFASTRMVSKQRAAKELLPSISTITSTLKRDRIGWNRLRKLTPRHPFPTMIRHRVHRFIRTIIVPRIRRGCSVLWQASQPSQTELDQERSG